MQSIHRLTPTCGRAAVMAFACLLVPLSAKDPRGAVTAAQRETDQRRIDIQEAEELLAQGDLAYDSQRYGDAVTAFSGARNLIPDAPVSRQLREAATDRLVQASVEHAKALARKGDQAGAITAIDAVLDRADAPTAARARAARARLDDPIRTNPALTKEHGAQVDEVRRLLYTADGAFDLGNFDQAHAHYQKVLGIDPTNSAARRGMERVAKAKSDYAKAAADQTRAEMLSQVEAGWEMPVNAPTLDMTTLDPGDDTGSAPSPRVPLSLKIERIVLPTFMLSEASLEEAVDLLRQRSVEFDLSEADPALRGINFDLQLGSAESPAGNAIRAKRLTLSLNSIPIAKALDYITSQTRTTYSTDGYAVVIRPLEAESNTLETRTFRVPPDFLVILGNESRKSGADDPFADKPGQGLLTERLGAREVLVKNGVRFPEGAGATLSNGRLAVTNTPANLAVVEAIVDSVAKTEPVMVVVTATIIKCTETRYKELSFDSMLGEIGFGGASWIPGADKLNFTGGTKGTGGDLGDMTLPTGQTSSNPITAGNRSGDEAAYIDSIDGAIARSFDKGRSSLSIPRSPGAFQVTKILDDSSATMILRGMARQKGVDVTTAASTVTTSGQASSVRSVREMRYPQAYEPPELPNSVGGDNDFNNNGGFGGGGRAPNAVTPSHPTDFTTREIGTILEVTPTADPEKRYVDVALVNTVTDFDGFVDWGSPINEPVTRTFAAVVNPLNARAVQISPNYILQPVFSMNRTTTSVSVADGQTIVISGMLQDRINRVNDRTPGYSRLPLIGRLFESDIDQPSSTAVVFMIKVRLVDPTGQPYNEREAPAER